MSMDTGTSGVDKGTSATPNRVLLELRSSRGWGRPRLAKELHWFCQSKGWPSPGEDNIQKQIYRLETGKIRSPDEFYTRLYTEFFDSTPHDLFGDLRADTGTSTTFGIISHKFIPVYIGAAAAENLSVGKKRVGDEQWTDCRSGPVEMEGAGTCTMYVWPFGVAVLHLVESLTPASIAEISVWRRSSYPQNIEWVTRHLEEQIGKITDEPYVLSAYWVGSAPWEGARLDTSLRLLSIPRVLTDREDDRRGLPSRAHAELVEQALLREGFDHPEIMPFGMRGISIGFASWSGVVYHPTAPGRALTEHELVSCELSVQAAWSYCNYIRTEVERGRDPVVPPKYGWRFVRGLRSRITTERPQETSQHRSMREAIVETSGLSRHLAQAVETLREADGGRA